MKLTRIEKLAMVLKSNIPHDIEKIARDVEQ